MKMVNKKAITAILQRLLSSKEGLVERNGAISNKWRGVETSTENIELQAQTLRETERNEWSLLFINSSSQRQGQSIHPLNNEKE